MYKKLEGMIFYETFLSGYSHNYVEGNFLHAREKRIKIDWKWMYVINSSLEDRA